MIGRLLRRMLSLSWCVGWERLAALVGSLDTYPSPLWSHAANGAPSRWSRQPWPSMRIWYVRLFFVLLYFPPNLVRHYPMDTPHWQPMLNAHLMYSAHSQWAFALATATSLINRYHWCLWHYSYSVTLNIKGKDRERKRCRSLWIHTCRRQDFKIDWWILRKILHNTFFFLFQTKLPYMTNYKSMMYKVVLPDFEEYLKSKQSEQSASSSQGNNISYTMVRR